MPLFQYFFETFFDQMYSPFISKYLNIWQGLLGPGPCWPARSHIDPDRGHRVKNAFFIVIFLLFTYLTWTLELGKNQISKALDIWVRSLQSIFEKNGRQKYVSWWPYLGRISINRRWTVGSRRLEHGRDDKSGVPLTTLLPHQLYKPFFSREGGRY